MSLLNKFSVSYNLEQANKKKHHHNENSELSKTAIKKNGLRNEVAQDLIELGYDIDILMMLIKIHPFTNVDEALNLLSRDPDTHLYNHKYYNPKVNSKLNIINEPCLICQGKKKEHINEDDLDIEFNNNNNFQNEKNEIQNELNTISNIKNNSNVNNNSNNISKKQSKEIKNNISINSKINNQTNNEYSQTPLIENNNINTLLQSKNQNDKNINVSTSNNLISSSSQSERKKKLDFGKIEIPKETLELFESPNICRICFSNKINPQNKAQISCGHFFCDNCIKTYLTNKIINGQVLDIKCLLGGCPKRYTDEEIQANVTDEVYKKYKKFRNIQIKLCNPNKIYINCPFPDCEEIVDCTNPESDFVECNNHHIFCYKCHKLGKHEKGKCLNDEMILLQEIQNKNKNGNNFKQCPKCNIIIEKNEGCNQMHCINCGYDFCWLCLKKYTENHYAMYNVSGCPGMRYESDSGYKWRKNPCLKFLWYLFSCFLAFLAAIVILIFYLIFGYAYEFYKCYNTKKTNDDDDENDFVDIDFYDDERDENIYDDNNYFQDENNINNDDRNNKINVNVVNNNNNNNNNEDADVNVNGNENSENNKNNEKKNNNIFIIIILIILGLICQPLYLLFYILYALMECYRRFNCWFYYVDY